MFHPQSFRSQSFPSLSFCFRFWNVASCQPVCECKVCDSSCPVAQLRPFFLFDCQEWEHITSHPPVSWHAGERPRADSRAHVCTQRCSHSVYTLCLLMRGADVHFLTRHACNTNEQTVWWKHINGSVARKQTGGSWRSFVWNFSIRNCGSVTNLLESGQKRNGTCPQHSNRTCLDLTKDGCIFLCVLPFTVCLLSPLIHPTKWALVSFVHSPSTTECLGVRLLIPQRRPYIEVEK